ncbi:membrane associated rhomboid family serine protease [Marmoricola sp. URHA0025 HA25]
MAQTSAEPRGGRIERAGEEADHSDWLDRAVRFGLVAYGAVYLMIAWVAGELALGNRSGRPSPQGALAKLAGQPFGHVLLWAVAVGLFVLVVWRVLEAFAGHRGADGAELVRKRGLSLGKAVLYGALGVSAVRVALGGGQSPRAPKTMTAKVMDWPAGQWIVGLAALAIVGYGVAMIWSGCTDRFLEHLDGRGRTGEAGRAYTWFGRVGHVAKGIAFGIVGGLVGYAALTHEPQKSGGLDQGLEKVLHQPFGPWLLLAIAIGIGCYGLFCFAWARHRSR